MIHRFASTGRADKTMMETPPLPEEMSEPSLPPATTAGRLRAAARRLPVVTAVAVVLVLGGMALLVWSLSGGAARPLYPNLPTFTPLAATVQFETQEVSFTDLNADPAAFQDQRLQVTGTYTPIEPPDCLDANGPLIRWSLVAEELQLNAIGFEDILRLVPEDTEMTVTGIWRAYRGPVGCGKEPADGTVWYLAVDRILAPNPLFGETSPALTVVAGTPATLTPEDAPTLATPTSEVTAEMTTVITGTTTFPGVASPTPSPTLPTTPLVTPQGTTGATPTVATTAEGTAALSPTPGPSPTPTTTGEAPGTTTPGLPTTTPSGTGYPGQGTPTATTTGGYP